MIKEGMTVISKKSGRIGMIDKVKENRVVINKSNGGRDSVPLFRFDECYSIVEDDHGGLINYQAEQIKELKRLLKEKDEKIKEQEQNLTNIRKAVELIEADARPTEAEQLKIRFASQVLISRMESTSKDVHEFIWQCANRAKVIVTLGLEDNS